MLSNLLTTNSVDLRTMIDTTVSRVINLLNDSDDHIRYTSINALSKLAVHGKTSALQFYIYLSQFQLLYVLH